MDRGTILPSTQNFREAYRVRVLSLATPPPNRKRRSQEIGASLLDLVKKSRRERNVAPGLRSARRVRTR
jgi:hypothetical protein